VKPVRISAKRVVALTPLVGAALLLVGCTSADPTDSSHFTDVHVRNDTPSAVQLIQCDTTCGTLHDRETLPTGGTTIINVSNEGIKIGYLIERPNGEQLGCIYMEFDGVDRTPVVPVSSMTKCD
jgi:hypothetical protein